MLISKDEALRVFGRSHVIISVAVFTSVIVPKDEQRAIAVLHQIVRVAFCLYCLIVFPIYIYYFNIFTNVIFNQLVSSFVNYGACY